MQTPNIKHTHTQNHLSLDANLNSTNVVQIAKAILFCIGTSVRNVNKLQQTIKSSHGRKQRSCSVGFYMTTLMQKHTACRSWNCCIQTIPMLRTEQQGIHSYRLITQKKTLKSTLSHVYDV
jgi:hypothetical protein